jgi:beta-lactamase class A
VVGEVLPLKRKVDEMKRIEAGRKRACGMTARVSFVLFALMMLPPDAALLSVRPHVGAARAAAIAQSEREVEQIVKRFADTSGGIVGVAAIHVESGRRISFNGAQRFPMASSYKLVIGLQLLNRVDRGEVHLSDMITLMPRDFRLSYSPLADIANGTPISLTTGRLLEMMVADSDNSASDAMLKVAGGPKAVTARARELGFKEIDVSRSEAELGAALSGVYELPPESEWSPEMFERLYAQAEGNDPKVIKEKFLADERDTATPDALAALLVEVFRGKALSASGTERLLKIMEATTTGPNRLKGLLPAGTVVAHKTGTWGSVGTTNDVGIITLPDGAGHVAIAVLVKASTKNVPERERAIAEITRTLYDFFLMRR